MRILSTVGSEGIARVYIGDFGDGRFIECVESVQPPLPREKKWVLMVSTLFGCPVKCLMCDAGGAYRGKLSRDEILAQIDFLVDRRYPDRRVPAEKFKIQFARIGEPSYNTSVLDVLEELPERYDAPGLIPSLSTVAPYGTDRFFERLLDVRERVYRTGRFQLQFSIHTTDEELRDRLMPIRKWRLCHIGRYGERFYSGTGRKVTLNFALAQRMPVDPDILLEHFDPDVFVVKITPINPTYRARESGLASRLHPDRDPQSDDIVNRLRESGYQVFPSIGEPEENLIGSNCGQYVIEHLRGGKTMGDGYTYDIHPHSGDIPDGAPPCTIKGDQRI
jgi:23S rRNA (adenine2503-C2)-methyltransferase